MGKMHPDDVNARDWDFMLSERFPEAERVIATSDWAMKSLSWLDERTKGYVAAARSNLVNAWPNALEGETLEPLIEALEAAFEPNRPAVSTAPRGDSTKARLEAESDEDRKLSDWKRNLHRYHHRHAGPTNAEMVMTLGGESYEIQVDQKSERVGYYRAGGREAADRALAEKDPTPPKVRKMAHGRCVVCDRPSRSYAEYCLRCWRALDGKGARSESKQAKLDVLKLRLRGVCDRFTALDIIVEPVTRGGQVGVRMLGTRSDAWTVKHEAVMTLTEAELWLDHFDKTSYSEDMKQETERKLLDVFRIPTAQLGERRARQF